MTPNLTAVLGLTDAEYEVFLALGDGKSSRQIAAERKVSVKTVETQFSNLRRKLHLSTITQVRVLSARFIERNGKPVRRKVLTKREFVPSA